ncbi:MAG: RHS repeat-associated core domain-containing protein, partial [Burkholderiales bacterium]
PVEDATGLSYLGARWYSPSLGRFYSVDPVHFTESNPFSFNRYAYGNNNPYRFVDPDGHFAIPIVLAAFGLAWTAYELSPYSMPSVPSNSGAVAGTVAPWEAIASVASVVRGSAAALVNRGLLGFKWVN